VFFPVFCVSSRLVSSHSESFSIVRAISQPPHAESSIHTETLHLSPLVPSLTLWNQAQSESGLRTASNVRSELTTATFNHLTPSKSALETRGGVEWISMIHPSIVWHVSGQRLLIRMWEHRDHPLAAALHAMMIDTKVHASRATVQATFWARGQNLPIP
jgi:hypothetical protein